MDGYATAIQPRSVVLKVWSMEIGAMINPQLNLYYFCKVKKIPLISMILDFKREFFSAFYCFQSYNHRLPKPTLSVLNYWHFKNDTELGIERLYNCSFVQQTRLHQLPLCSDETLHTHGTRVIHDRLIFGVVSWRLGRGQTDFTRRSSNHRADC